MVERAVVRAADAPAGVRGGDAAAGFAARPTAFCFALATVGDFFAPRAGFCGGRVPLRLSFTMIS
jgi:hypothetical protein